MSDLIPHIWGETAEGYESRLRAHKAHKAEAREHNCGGFDASYVSIRLEGVCWMLYCDGSPELNIEFCPYCGLKLNGNHS